MTEKPKYSLDRLVYWLMVTSLFVLALGCAPIQGLDWSSPSVKATFVFDVGFTTPYEMAVKNQTIIRQTITNRTITYPNGTVVVIATVAIITNSTGSVASVSGFLGDGFVTLEGRGGLSADNPLNISVTAYFRSNAFAGEPDIKFIPNGAYEANVISNPFAPVQPKTDTEKFSNSSRNTTKAPKRSMEGQYDCYLQPSWLPSCSVSN